MTTLRAALRLADALQAGADDPMWADHCEMSKRTASLAAAELRRLCAEMEALRSALSEPEQEPVATLKRGITGRCTRKRCECEIEGLGLECIHLEPVIDGYPLWSGIPKPDDTALLRQALDCLENHVMQRTYAGGVVIANTAIALRERLGEKT